MNEISPSQIAELKKSHKVNLIDVRMPTEYREVHAEGAVNVPLDQLDPTKLMPGPESDANTPVYLICKSGSRSAMACRKFKDAGFENAVSVTGGTQAWEQAGLPVQRGKKSVSLERQVRIVAGFLTLTGAILGYFVNVHCIALSGFIGAGLMFAGITDTCGMGMMLSKMPWNQCDNRSSCSVS